MVPKYMGSIKKIFWDEFDQYMVIMGKKVYGVLSRKKCDLRKVRVRFIFPSYLLSYNNSDKNIFPELFSCLDNKMRQR